MNQLWENYTREDHSVWNILFERQKENLKNNSCPEYLESLEELSDVMNSDSVPDFQKVDEQLIKKTGWSIEVVPGLIPVGDFFRLLSQKRFCSSTWLRKMSQLDYLEEPDMFHDTFGHVPLLMNPIYSDFVHRFGLLGLDFLNDETKLVQLQRLYWFTIEFGIFKNKSIYGAGIISSFGETNHVFGDDIKIIPFDIEEILNRPFIQSEIQAYYYAIDDFKQLWNSIESAKSLLN